MILKTIFFIRFFNDRVSWNEKVLNDVKLGDDLYTEYEVKSINML